MIKGHNFCEVSINVPINQVKKISKRGSFGSNQAPIDTNILSTQIKVCTYLMGYYPLSHKSMPTKEATRNKRESLYGQIMLKGQGQENKRYK